MAIVMNYVLHVDAGYYRFEHKQLQALAGYIQSVKTTPITPFQEKCIREHCALMSLVHQQGLLSIKFDEFKDYQTDKEILQALQSKVVDKNDFLYVALRAEYDARVQKYIRTLEFREKEIDASEWVSSLQDSSCKKIAANTQEGFTHYSAKVVRESDLSYPNVFMKKDPRSATARKDLDVKVSVIYGIENKSWKYTSPKSWFGWRKEKSLRLQPDITPCTPTNDQFRKYSAFCQNRLSQEANSVQDLTQKYTQCGKCSKIDGQVTFTRRGDVFNNSQFTINTTKTLDSKDSISPAQALFEQRGLAGDTKGWFSW